MKLNKGESGQTLIVIALCMTVLLGFIALAVDVGMLFQTWRNMQVAARAVCR
jgi:Flp pilus assembly protein TadG